MWNVLAFLAKPRCVGDYIIKPNSILISVGGRPHMFWLPPFLRVASCLQTLRGMTLSWYEHVCCCFQQQWDNITYSRQSKKGKTMENMLWQHSILANFRGVGTWWKMKGFIHRVLQQSSTYIEQNLDSLEFHFSERPHNNIKFSEGSTTVNIYIYISTKCSVRSRVHKALFHWRALGYS